MGIEKEVLKSNFKSASITVGVLVVVFIGSFVFGTIKSKNKTDSSNKSIETNSCDSKNDLKSCHDYLVGRMNDLVEQNKIASKKGKESTFRADSIPLLQSLKQNCEKNYSKSCLYLWPIFPKEDYLNKSLEGCTVNRDEENCGPVYDALKKVSEGSDNDFGKAIASANELGVKPFVTRIRFSRSEISTVLSVEELLNRKESYNEKIITVIGYGFVMDFKDGFGSLYAQESHNSKPLHLIGLRYFSKEKENKIKEFCPKKNESDDSGRNCGKIKIWGQLFLNPDDKEVLGFDVWDIEPLGNIEKN